MAICANQGRMYMGTARQYMEKQRGCQSCHSMQAGRTVRTLEKGICDRQNEKKENCQCEHSECSERSKQSLCYREDGCQPESMCMDLPLAMAYMNPQPYTGLVDCDMALSRGSAFNNLYDPWNPGKYC